MEEDNGIYCPGCGDEIVDDGGCYTCDYNPSRGEGPEDWDALSDAEQASQDWLDRESDKLDMFRREY